MMTQLCPKCGAEMVKRRSKKGEFWGCSKFPDCKGIINIEGTEQSKVQAMTTPLVNSAAPSLHIAQVKTFCYYDEKQLDNAVNMFAQQHKVFAWQPTQLVISRPDKILFINTLTYEG